MRLPHPDVDAVVLVIRAYEGKRSKVLQLRKEVPRQDNTLLAALPH